MKASDFSTFEEFQAAPNAVAIFYGDWGGEVYASVPMRLFSGIGPDELRDLAIRLEQVCWDCNITAEDPQGGACVAFKIQKPGTGVIGGMGGGLVVDGVWISPDLPEIAREFIKEKLSDAV